MTTAENIARLAKGAASAVAKASAGQKNAALYRFAELLHENRADICAANNQDRANAEGKIDDAKLERLSYTEARIQSTIDGINQIIQLPDPVGEIDEWRHQPSGIQVGKMRVPLGVILMIYESRPNVTADAAALALKAGNAVILRGGSEAQQTNNAISDCLRTALREQNLSDSAQVISNGDRQLVQALLQQEDNIDVVIPRGGRGLIERVMNDSKIPVIKHMDGNCHIYIDRSADTTMAVAVADNAKNRRYGVCNAAESLLAHSAVAEQCLPLIAQKFADRGVEMRVCAQSKKILNDFPKVTDADESDWRREYLAPIISIRVVESLDEAIAHINAYGSGHSDAIITDNQDNAWRFFREVDSSSVLVNASTGFADGYEYGLGAEIGISTNKLHARGPVGVVGLTTQKYVVLGNGNCRP